jgi:hypothetical protein
VQGNSVQLLACTPCLHPLLAPLTDAASYCLVLIVSILIPACQQYDCHVNLCSYPQSLTMCQDCASIEKLLCHRSSMEVQLCCCSAWNNTAVIGPTTHCHLILPIPKPFPVPCQQLCQGQTIAVVSTCCISLLSFQTPINVHCLACRITMMEQSMCGRACSTLLLHLHRSHFRSKSTSWLASPCGSDCCLSCRAVWHL